MAIDTKYGPEVADLVKVMRSKPDGVPLRYPEIEQLVKKPITDVQFHQIVSAAVRKLRLLKIPVVKVRSNKKINLPGGIVRLSPSEVPQLAYDKQTKGHNRVANNAIADIDTVEISGLTDEEQILVHAVHATAKMAQTLVTEDTRDRLKDEIRKSGKLTDTQALAKLLQKNL
jgi:hypothetical protein